MTPFERNIRKPTILVIPRVDSVPAFHEGDQGSIPRRGEREREVIFFGFKTIAHQFSHDDGLTHVKNKWLLNKEINYKNVPWTVDS